jgi:hypothetical protein
MFVTVFFGYLECEIYLLSENRKSLPDAVFAIIGLQSHSLCTYIHFQDLEIFAFLDGFIPFFGMDIISAEIEAIDIGDGIECFLYCRIDDIAFVFYLQLASWLYECRSFII